MLRRRVESTRRTSLQRPRHSASSSGEDEQSQSRPGAPAPARRAASTTPGAARGSLTSTENSKPVPHDS